MKLTLTSLLLLWGCAVSFAQSDPTRRLDKNLRANGSLGFSEAGLTRQDSLAIWQAISTGLASSTGLSATVTSLSTTIGGKVGQPEFNNYKTNAAIAKAAQDALIGSKLDSTAYRAGVQAQAGVDAGQNAQLATKLPASFSAVQAGRDSDQDTQIASKLPTSFSATQAATDQAQNDAIGLKANSTDVYSKSQTYTRTEVDDANALQNQAISANTTSLNTKSATINAATYAAATTAIATLQAGVGAIVKIEADESPGNAGTGTGGVNPRTYYLYFPAVGLIQQVTYPN